MELLKQKGKRGFLYIVAERRGIDLSRGSMGQCTVVPAR